jgi:hypothetical protein
VFSLVNIRGITYFILYYFNYYEAK